MIQVAENKQAEIYKTQDTVYAQVLEITEHFVIGLCMISEEGQRFQKRRYNKDVLCELDLKEDDIIEITVFTKPGEIKSTYTKNTNPDVRKKFRIDDPFKDIDFSKILQPLPSDE